jgi:hypothetical protein
MLEVVGRMGIEASELNPTPSGGMALGSRNQWAHPLTLVWHES